MIPVFQLQGKRVAVMGLGQSGLSAARALRAGGAVVSVWDDQAPARAKAEAEGFKAVQPSSAAWSGLTCIIWSPGIAHTLPKAHSAAMMARSLGIPLVSDVDLLCGRKPSATYVAITGTNGKSTTTALIAHLLNHAGQPASAGGNIGVPALDLPEYGFTGTYVLELSSYQLEITPHLSADVAVWLNLTPDHLDRHGGMAGYGQAKMTIFAHPHPNATAVIAVDDEASLAAFRHVRQTGNFGRMVAVSVLGKPDLGPTFKGLGIGSVWVSADGRLHDGMDGSPHVIFDLNTCPTLRGVHNWQNAACAYAAAKSRGVPVERIVTGMQSFAGLAHRQQRVATIEDVVFINDSKATNADAAAKALVCYDSILWIAGGQAKEGGIESLTPHFPRLRHAFLIGEAAPDFARVLKAANVSYTLCADLEDAVLRADEMAEHGDTVLLSPAAASFDQFRNFEHRGEVFMEIVADLATDDGEEIPR